MKRSFEFLDKLGDAVIPASGLDSQGKRRDNIFLRAAIVVRGHQTYLEQLVHSGLERISGTPNFAIDQLGDIVVDSKSLSHIMMLNKMAS